MSGDYKKRLTMIITLKKGSSMFAGVMFNGRQFKVKGMVFYGPNAVFNSEATVSDNTTALQALSSVVGGVSINNSLIECVNNLCNSDGGNWNSFNDKQLINPSTYILRPDETIYFIYVSNKTEQFNNEAQINYEAIMRLLKMN